VYTTLVNVYYIDIRITDLVTYNWSFLSICLTLSLESIS